MTYAISLLDNPLLQANRTLHGSCNRNSTRKQVLASGRESVAIGEILESPKIIYKEIQEDEKSIH